MNKAILEKKINNVIESDVIHFIYDSLTDREKEVVHVLMKNQLYYYETLSFKRKKDFMNLFAFKDEETMLSSVIYYVYNKRKDVDIYAEDSSNINAKIDISYSLDKINTNCNTNLFDVTCDLKPYNLMNGLKSDNNDRHYKMLIVNTLFIFYSPTQKGFIGGVLSVDVNDEVNDTDDKKEDKLITEYDFIKISLSNIRRVFRDCDRVMSCVEEAFGTDTRCFCEVGKEEIVENLETYFAMKYGLGAKDCLSWYIWECEIGNKDNSIIKDAINGKSNFKADKEYFIINDETFIDMILEVYGSESEK